MGKQKSGGGGLGQALRNSKEASKYKKFSELHSIELDDTSEYVRRERMKSIIENNDLDEFVSHAIMSGRDFTAERQTVVIVADQTPQIPQASNPILSRPLRVRKPKQEKSAGDNGESDQEEEEGEEGAAASSSAVAEDDEEYDDDDDEDYDEEDDDDYEDIDDDEDEEDEDEDEDGEEDADYDGQEGDSHHGDHEHHHGEDDEVDDDGQKTLAFVAPPKKKIMTGLNRLRIPKRPKWDANTTPQQLQRREKDSFLKWRRKLAVIEETAGVLVTPYEKNLEVWRQLWRVLERSDLIIQIVDARNPLLYRCVDLERYVEKLDKSTMLLLNKADLLPPVVRRDWARYFKEQGVQVLFFSANNEAEKLQAEHQIALEKAGLLAEELEAAASAAALDLDVVEEEKKLEEERRKEGEHQQQPYQRPASLPLGVKMMKRKEKKPKLTPEEEEKTRIAQLRQVAALAEMQRLRLEEQEAAKAEQEEDEEAAEDEDEDMSIHVYDREELIDVLKKRATASMAYSRKWIHEGNSSASIAAMAAHANDPQARMPVIGFVGYPNVGKSSTVNVLCHAKKVAVAATPGKTKHFQTLILDEGMIVCDCPGLVFPSAITTKADMVCNGVLPIDQLREAHGPAELLSQRIPRRILERTYGLELPLPSQMTVEAYQRQLGDKSGKVFPPPTSSELLTAFALARGFYATGGGVDQPKAARTLLKDYVKGKLLYCHLPPDTELPPFEILAAREGFCGFAGAMEILPEGTRAKKKAPRQRVGDEELFSADAQEKVKALVKSKMVKKKDIRAAEAAALRSRPYHSAVPISGASSYAPPPARLVGRGKAVAFASVPSSSK